MKKQPLQPRQRKGRAIRNLLAAAALCAVIWHLLGTPMPDLWEFRNMERQALIPPTEIILDLPDGSGWGHGYVGLGKDVAVAAFPEIEQLQVHPLSEDPHLLRLQATFFVYDPELDFGTGFVALQPPQEAQSAQLTVRSGRRVVASGNSRRDKAFFFIVPSKVFGSADEPYTYELTYFDRAGEVIETVTGQ